MFDNPWKHIGLKEYESHMRLASVMQLQAMDRMMEDQLYHYNVSSVMILGIAGGNGLNHVKKEKFRAVYGVDINNDYLKQCAARYPLLKGCFYPVEADLTDNAKLPEAELIVANLIIEYIGYENFQRAINKVCPKYVSCIIQVNTGTGFVSDSPYLHVFDGLNEVHHDIDKKGLTIAMKEIGYFFIMEDMEKLPNGKALLRLDYKK